MSGALTASGSAKSREAWWYVMPIRLAARESVAVHICCWATHAQGGGVEGSSSAAALRAEALLLFCFGETILAGGIIIATCAV